MKFESSSIKLVRTGEVIPTEGRLKLIASEGMPTLVMDAGEVN